MRKSILWLLVALTSCQPAKTAADYLAATEVCQSATSCQEYVSCMKSVAASFGKDYGGRCE